MWVQCNPNPLGRQAGDCVVRAIAIATNSSWRDTRRKTIRTLRRVLRQGRERIDLITFAVINDEFQFIIINIDGIDERFDDVPAEERIRAVSLGELAEEEENTVPVDQLRL